MTYAGAARRSVALKRMNYPGKRYASTRSFALGALGILCVACFRGPIFGPPPPIATVSVFIAPRDAALGPMRPGDTVRVVVEASAANGDFLPVPSAVTWMSSRPDIVQLEPTAAREQRIARAINPGTAVLSVVMAGVTGQATLTIAP